jgi:hypothetical protein
LLHHLGSVEQIVDCDLIQVFYDSINKEYTYTSNYGYYVIKARVSKFVANNVFNNVVLNSTMNATMNSTNNDKK